MLAWSSWAVSAVEPVVLAAGTGPVPLAGHIEVLHEADPAWTLDEVRKPQNASRFVKDDAQNFSFGYSRRRSELNRSASRS